MTLELLISLTSLANIVVCIMIIFISFWQKSNGHSHKKSYFILLFGLLAALFLLLFSPIYFDPVVILLGLIVVFYMLLQDSKASSKVIYQDKPELIAQAKEQERSRIYANLHDDVGAKLLELIYTAENDKTKLLAKEVLSDIRQAVASTVNVKCNLGQLLEEISAELKLRLSTTSSIEMSEKIKLNNNKQALPANITSVVSRIIREITSNIIKHSNANKVELIAESNHEHFILTITDNGIGFKENNNGKGLKTVQKRAQSINAQVKWQENEPQGTIFTIKTHYANE